MGIGRQNELDAENARLRAVNAELLILIKASFSFSQYSAAIHFTEPRKPTKEWLVGHAELIEDLQPKLEAAIAKATQS